MASSMWIVVVLLLCCTAITSSCRKRRISREGQLINLKKLATANNDLSLKLLHQLTANSTGNVFFSPLGLSTTFGMLYLGARGDTKKELGSVLGYDTAGIQQNSVQLTFQFLLRDYLSSQDNFSVSYLNRHFVLSLANAVLLDKRLNIVTSYKNDVQKIYQALVQDVDFMKEAPEIVDEINRWVQEKTNGKIKSLVKDLHPDTSLLLLNAVNFKAPWDFKFLKTRPRTFYNNGVENGAKEVPMMETIGRFHHTTAYGFRALELPYKGNDISMIIFLPNERDGLESIEKNLTLEKLSVVREELKPRKRPVTIPKFKIEYSKDMSGDFMSIGFKRVFTSDNDFSGIASDINITSAQVLHKAVVEINENGTEAAAATGFRIPKSRNFGFLVDHPFLFAIVDKRVDMILFLGRITNL